MKVNKYFYEALAILGAVVLSFQAERLRVYLEERNLEVTYYKNLAENLKSDTVMLSGFIRKNDELMLSCRELMKILENPREEDKANFIRLNANIASELFFYPHNATFLDIVSSGNSKVLRDQAIRSTMYKYYQNIEREKLNTEESVSLYQHHLIGPQIALRLASKEGIVQFFDQKSNLESLDLVKLSSDKEYYAALLTKTFSSNAQNGSYREIISGAEELLLLLAEVNQNENSLTILSSEN